MSLTSYKMEGNVENEQKTEIFEKSQETPKKLKDLHQDFVRDEH